MFQLFFRSTIFFCCRRYVLDAKWSPTLTYYYVSLLLNIFNDDDNNDTKKHAAFCFELKKMSLSLSSFNGWSVVLNWMTIFLCTILLLFAAFLCVCANKTFKIEFLLFNKIGFQAVYMQMQSVRKMQMIAT